MKKKYFSVLFFLLSIFIFSNDNTEIEVNNENKKNESSGLSFEENELPPNRKENVEEEINLIKNRTGENKAGLYFKALNDQGNAILFLDGFWDASFFVLSQIEFFKDYTKFKSVQPIFKQKANLSLWLLLNKQFYFETIYKDEYEKSVLAFGFLGKEDSTVRHIRISNSGIKFPTDYGYIDTGGGNIIAPGIMGSFAGDNWQVDTVLRYESAEFNSKSYYGKNEILKNVILSKDWLKAQFFYIPSESLYNKPLKIYVKEFENANWKELSKDDYHINTIEKYIILKKAYPNGVAVNYFDFSFNLTTANAFLARVNSEFAGSVSVSTNIDAYSQTGLNKKLLILKKKNTFSPFEIASFYEGSSGQPNFITVIDSITETPQSDFIVTTNYGLGASSFLENKNIVQIFYTSELHSGFSEPKNIFPFVNTEDKNIYLPKNNLLNPKFKILSETYMPYAEFVLPKNTIAGSIKVFKNKIEIFDFDYNEVTNVLTINQEIASNDFVEIKWQEGKLYSSSGAVKLATGIHWQPVNSLDMFFAIGSDWEISRQSIAVNDCYKFSSGIEFNKHNIKTGSVIGFDLITNRNKAEKKKYDLDNYIFKNKSYFSYSLKKNIYSVNSIPVFSNPHFYIDSFVETKKKDSGVIFSSQADATIDIWKIKLGGKLAFQNKKNNFIKFYGHSVSVPIYFFYMDEKFFVNANEKILRRENNIFFDKYVAIKYLTAINYNKEFVNQNIRASISPIIEPIKSGSFFTELKFDLRQKYKNNENITDVNYSKAWTKSLIDSYSEGRTDAITRYASLKFIFNFFPFSDENDKKAKFLGFDFNSNVKINFKNEKLKKSEEVIDFNISLPFQINNVFLTPLITRRISRHKPDSELITQNNYAEDLNSIFTGWGKQHWFFSKPFLYDMIDKKINKQIQIQDDNLYYFYNSYGFSLSRLIKLSMVDLFLPISFTVNISRNVQSEKSFLKASNIYGLEFLNKYISVNISGKYGMFDWFSWYEQDELNRLYKYAFYFGENYFKFNFLAENSLMLLLNHGNKLEFENKFNCKAIKIESEKLHLNSWSEEFSFAFVLSANKSLPSLIVKKFSKVTLNNYREEKLTFKLFQEETSPRLNYLVSFRHTQTTKIGNNGEIKLFANLEGKSSLVNSFLLDIKAGIFGKIEY